MAAALPAYAKIGRKAGYRGFLTIKLAKTISPSRDSAGPEPAVAARTKAARLNWWLTFVAEMSKAARDPQPSTLCNAGADRVFDRALAAQPSSCLR
jgi:hypothetical protein